MNISFDRVELHLQPSEVLRIQDQQGARVECVSGGLWITQDRDAEDHLLSANDSFTLEHRGLALVHAQTASDLILSGPAPRPTLRARIARWIAKTFGPDSLDRPRQLVTF